MNPFALLKRGSPGQAMVLGSVALFALALGVMATLNLGQAVHEKIKLQNTADSAAYSLATMEARTFNFIAFTNRVQITHYNAAMAMQSYLSYAGYAQAVMGTVVDLLRALSMGLQTGCQQAAPPPLKAAYCAINAIVKIVSKIADMVFKISNLIYGFGHYLAKEFVEAMALFNRDSIYRIQVIKAIQLNAHIVTGMEDFIKRNDNQLGWTAAGTIFPSMLVNSGLNSYEYWTAFDKAAGFNPALFGLFTAFSDVQNYKKDASDDGVKQAQAIMAEIANGTRSHKDIYDRSSGSGISLGLIGVSGTKKGQTRLIGKDGDLTPDPGIDAIRTQDHYQKCTGDRLASDDYLTGATGFATVVLESVVLSKTEKIGDGILTVAGSDSKHYRYKFNSGQLSGPKDYDFIPWQPSDQRQDSFETEDNKHKWAGSPFLAPYFKFQISKEKTDEFNQPSTWIYLNKRPENFQTGANKTPWHQKFTMTGLPKGNYVRGATATDGNNLTFTSTGTDTVGLDTTIGGERTGMWSWIQGLNVMSRGQVYYHRPADWQEHPNFFNPFWRARLAPMAQKLLNLYEKLVSNNLAPSSSSSMVMKIIRNFINNALSDFFFRIVTQVLTH